MSRLVAVSNRISVPKRGTAPGGLAVGLLAAMQARRGLWFGWDGEAVETAASEPSVVRKEGVTFASVDFDQEVVGAQAGQRTSVLSEDDRVDGDQIHRRAKHHVLRRCECRDAGEDYA